MSTLSSIRTAPTRIAVFGSVAAPPEPIARPAKPAEDSGQGRLPPAATAVLERIRVLLAANAPGIARPILDRALAAGTITATECSYLLGEFSGAPPAPAPARAAVVRLHQEILAAVRRAAPTLAKPLLKEAVASERLTAAQERRIIEQLRLSGGRPPRYPSSYEFSR
ncbi:MAG TPA: hypothetical protein VHM72_08360 [Solirubrobacteraceae bacterium]|nr:hypothetical protein [Solirubrobacteraceae bacterium]